MGFSQEPRWVTLQSPIFHRRGARLNIRNLLRVDGVGTSDTDGLNTFQQLGNGDPKASGQHLDRTEAGLAASILEFRDVASPDP